MNVKLILTVVCLIIMSLFLANCGAQPPAMPDEDETAAQSAVAEEATATPTPVPPTATPTPVPPTNTPTPTFSEMLQSNGFEPAPAYAISPGTTIVEPFVVEESLTYAKNLDEFILAYILGLSDQSILNMFQVELQQPDLLLTWLTGQLLAVNIETQTTLTGLSGIGDGSSVGGVSILTTLLGQPVKADIVVFQRNSKGAIVAVIYGANQSPTIPAADVALQLDEQIMSGD